MYYKEIEDNILVAIGESKAIGENQTEITPEEGFKAVLNCSLAFRTNPKIPTLSYTNFTQIHLNMLHMIDQKNQ